MQREEYYRKEERGAVYKLACTGIIRKHAYYSSAQCNWGTGVQEHLASGIPNRPGLATCHQQNPKAEQQW